MPRLDHMKGEVSVRNLERKKCPELAVRRLSPSSHGAQPHNRHTHTHPLPIMQSEMTWTLPDSAHKGPSLPVSDPGPSPT